MENFYSEYIKGGYWAIPMIIANSMGLRPTKLLTQLVSEFNFAIKHGYTYDNEFLTNYKRLCRCLNLTMDELNNLIQISFFINKNRKLILPFPYLYYLGNYYFVHFAYFLDVLLKYWDLLLQSVLLHI